MEPGSAQWHIVGGWEAKGVTWNVRGLAQLQGKHWSPGRQPSRRSGFPERLCSLPSVRFPRHDRILPWATWPDLTADPALSRRLDWSPLEASCDSIYTLRLASVQFQNTHYTQGTITNWSEQKSDTNITRKQVRKGPYSKTAHYTTQFSQKHSATHCSLFLVLFPTHLYCRVLFVHFNKSLNPVMVLELITQHSLQKKCQHACITQKHLDIQVFDKCSSSIWHKLLVKLQKSYNFSL